MTRILGIAPDMWISSAAIVVDGELIAAVPEERFDRRKMSKAFPVKAIEYCLSQAGCTLGEIDEIVVPWNPGVSVTSASSRYTNSLQWRGDYLHAFAGSLLNMQGSPVVNCIEEIIHHPDGQNRIKFINHHAAHMASTFYLSPFQESAILTIDGRGEDETGTWARGSGNTIERLQMTKWPHSLGLLYSVITQFLGFTPHTDEWKVMALAAYGSPDSPYYDKIKSLIHIQDDGQYEMDLTMFTYYWFDKQPRFYSDKLIALLGPERKKSDPLDARHYDIACALQRVFEEVCVHLLGHLHKITELANVCLAGGGIMNSVFNGKIIRKTPFKNVFIPPFPDDSGVSIGAALHGYYDAVPYGPRMRLEHNYLGPQYTSDEVGKLVTAFGLKARRVDEIEHETAQLLVDGKLIGWFQGRMEFGQRALGNRSIIADPRHAETQNKVNLAVKFREKFRPFAPAILEERAAEYFELDAGVSVPFMERVYPVKEDKRAKIPAVVFVDGSGRLQTVSAKTNPRFHKLISAFDQLTGVPILLNTSFNLNGEPVVCSPTDAIRTFFSCGLDALVVEDWLILKQ